MIEVETRSVVEDGTVLAGTLSMPAGDGPWPVVVALHGASGGSRDHRLLAHLRDTLVPVGIAVLRYDRRGEGATGGAVGAPLERLAADARVVVDNVGARTDVGVVGVWGISQGGWLGPMAAADDPTVSFVVAVSASGVSPAAQMRFAMENVLRERGFDDDAIAAAHRARSEVEERFAAGDVEGAVAARTAVDGEPWLPFAYLPDLDDLTGEPFGMDHEPADVWSQLRVPTLAVYGTWDRWVPIEPSIGVWHAAFDGREDLLTVERIPGVGHMMTTPDDLRDLDEAGPVAPAYADALRRWLASTLA